MPAPTVEIRLYTSQTPPQEGTTFRVVQVVKGRQNTIRGVITKMEPAGFAWKAKGQPLGGSYRYRPLPDGGTEITQTISYGSDLPVVGLLVDWIASTFVMPRADMAAHLDEEMARLQQVLEAAEQAT